MKAKPDRSDLLPAAAFAVFAIALVWAAATLVRTRASLDRITGLRREQEEILQARIRIDEARAFADAFAPGADRIETPASLHGRFFPRRPPEFIERDPGIETPAGRLRRVEWLIEDVPAELVFVFAAACESARPPWRVETIRLSAVPGAEGRVRGGLVLVGVHP